MDKVVQFPGLGLEFHFNTIAFSIGSIHVAWYGILITLGLLLAIIYCFRRLKIFGLNNDRVIDVVIGGIIGGIIGGRAYYVAFSWDDYKYYIWDVFKVWEGGMAIYGAIIGALVVGIIICKIRHVRIMPMLDVASLGFLIGQTIGRWGNFVNVEAFGSNTSLPWGMTGPDIQNYLTNQISRLAQIGVTVDATQPVHPCFLYESIWCLIGFILLHLYTKHRKFDGEMFLMYVGWYGLGRAVIEGLRTDPLLIGGLRVSQILAIVCVIVSVILILVVRSKIKNAHDPDFMPLYVTTDESKMMMEGTYDAYEKEQRKLKKQAKEEAKQKKMMAKLRGQEEEELEPIAQPQEETQDPAVVTMATETKTDVSTQENAESMEADAHIQPEEPVQEELSAERDNSEVPTQEAVSPEMATPSEEPAPVTDEPQEKK
ncbi:MAG TPA: prolipoprotein diacylglyceryl transferase [Firmicutes bacterium]|nr:prolipoprotein diacylglyceryl transferase [Bacillota bacterium]